MSKIVYIFGAGINRGVSDWNGLKPPLATDFFKQLLQSEKFSSDHYLEKLNDLLVYINNYWKLSKEDLKKQQFDLEGCFTLIQLQKEDASLDNDREAFLSLSRIEIQLISLLAEFLNEFAHFTHRSDSFRELGNILYSQQPTILTFNYDTLLEEAIESASHVRAERPACVSGRNNGEILDDELPYSHFNWNRPLSYGMKFDDVELHRAGVSAYVSGEHFYSHPENNLYDWSILKLHGSLNWFTYSGLPKYQHTGIEFESKKGKSILCNAHYWFNELPDLKNEILVPLIITPVLYKQLRNNEIIYNTWKKAKEKLSTCERLVIGGYSFPPTDFYTKRLFYEAFKDHKPKEIVVINPDTSIIKIVKELCHFKKPVLACKNLDEYIECYIK